MREIEEKRETLIKKQQEEMSSSLLSGAMQAVYLCLLH